MTRLPKLVTQVRVRYGDGDRGAGWGGALLIFSQSQSRWNLRKKNKKNSNYFFNSRRIIHHLSYKKEKKSKKTRVVILFSYIRKKKEKAVRSFGFRTLARGVRIPSEPLLDDASFRGCLRLWANNTRYTITWKPIHEDSNTTHKATRERERERESPAHILYTQFGPPSISVLINNLCILRSIFFLHFL